MAKEKTMQTAIIVALGTIAVILVIWIVYDIGKHGGFSFRDGIAVLGTVVAIIGVVAVWPNQSSTQPGERVPTVRPTMPIQLPVPTSEKILVSATSSPGCVYRPAATGNYVFQYESGAYSTQLTDDAIWPNLTWHTAVRFFKQIKNWRDDQTSAGIAKPDWAIDVGTPYRYKESEALSDAQSAMNTGKMLVVINLEQNVPIYLVVSDTSPENNRGGVWLSVIRQK
jgi:hypothetical protein